MDYPIGILVKVCHPEILWLALVCNHINYILCFKINVLFKLQLQLPLLWATPQAFMLFCILQAWIVKISHPGQKWFQMPHI